MDSFYQIMVYVNLVIHHAQHVKELWIHNVFHVLLVKNCKKVHVLI